MGDRPAGWRRLALLGFVGGMLIVPAARLFELFAIWFLRGLFAVVDALGKAVG
jgi:hypothetical protein